MLEDQLKWSKDYSDTLDRNKRVSFIYKQALEAISEYKLLGHTINPNNPKEVIATLYLLLKDYNDYHERF